MKDTNKIDAWDEEDFRYPILGSLERLERGLNPIDKEEWRREVGYAGDSGLKAILKSIHIKFTQGKKTESDVILLGKIKSEFKNWSDKYPVTYGMYKKMVFPRKPRLLFKPHFTLEEILWCKRRDIIPIPFGIQIIPDEFWKVMSTEAKKGRIPLSQVVSALKGIIFDLLLKAGVISYLSTSHNNPTNVKCSIIFGLESPDALNFMVRKEGKPPPRVLNQPFDGPQADLNQPEASNFSRLR